MGVQPLTHPAAAPPEPLCMPAPGTDAPSSATSDTQPDWPDCRPEPAKANAHNWDLRTGRTAWSGTDHPCIKRSASRKTGRPSHAE
jgi:hypothetical protein